MQRQRVPAAEVPIGAEPKLPSSPIVKILAVGMKLRTAGKTFPPYPIAEIVAPCAEAGSYELRDNVMRMRPVVAKNQSAMAPGLVLENEYRLAGDTLWLTLRRGARGAEANPPTIKLVRVE